MQPGTAADHVAVAIDTLVDGVHFPSDTPAEDVGYKALAVNLSDLAAMGATATEAVAVPDSAIVDDAGQPVVFVQVGGESFQRRAVQLGNREAGLVQITGDIEPRERIVTRGAPLIRLAALSPQVPAHGHTH